MPGALSNLNQLAEIQKLARKRKFNAALNVCSQLNVADPRIKKIKNELERLRAEELASLNSSISNIIRNQKYDHAIEIIEDIETDYFSDPELRVQIAIIYTQLNETDKSIRLLNTLNDKDLNASMSYNVSLCYKKASLFNEAYFFADLANQKKPDDERILINLGNLERKMGHIEKAIDRFEKILNINPKNETAQFSLAAIRNESFKKAPNNYVKALFDNYAHSFDEHLKEKLGYEPDKLYRLLGKLDPSHNLGRVYDLGCGTGLVGQSLSSVDELVGVDLSDKMLDHARRKNCYHRLIQSDIEIFLERNEEICNTIICADVLTYIGELDHLIKLIGLRLAKGGYLLFTIETTTKSDFELHANRRYSHSIAYVTKLLHENDIHILLIEESTLRKQFLTDVHGAHFICARN